MKWKYALWAVLGIAGAYCVVYLPLLWAPSSEISLRYMSPTVQQVLKLGWPVGLLLGATLAVGPRIRDHIANVALALSVLVIPLAIVQAVHFWIQSGVALGVLLWVSIWSAVLGARLVPSRLASRGGLMVGEIVGGAVGMILGLIPMFLAACLAGTAIHRDCGM